MGHGGLCSERIRIHTGGHLWNLGGLNKSKILVI